MKKRIEIVDEVVKVIEFCESCPLIGACLEYWTGDDTENQD